MLSRILAHSSLVIYITVLIWLLISLRRAMQNKSTQYIYASLCFWLLLAIKDLSYLFGNIWYDTEVTNILMSIDLWPTPIMTIILMHTVQPLWLSFWRVASMTVPFFVFTLLNIILKGNETVFVANQIYGFIFASIFGVIILRITYKCDNYIESNYSNKVQIDIRWVRYIIIAMYTICLLWLLASIQCTWLGDAFLYLSITGLTTMLFYYSLTYKKIIFPNYMVFSDDSAKSLKIESDITKQRYAEIATNLNKAVYEDKIFLNPHLTLNDLANHIGTNRAYLSRYINNHISTSFFNYINGLRLEEVHRILKDTTNTHTIIEVSEQCGFASYSTFRRVFKSKYGYAPSQHRYN